MRTRPVVGGVIQAASLRCPGSGSHPQKREFFELYAQASANAVEIARLLVDLLETFPQDGDSLIARIKEREHDGDRLTHEVVLLLNSTFVTPFDRDDMYRLAGRDRRHLRPRRRGGRQPRLVGRRARAGEGARAGRA